jgi:hypothetical protein
MKSKDLAKTLADGVKNGSIPIYNLTKQQDLAADVTWRSLRKWCSPRHEPERESVYEIVRIYEAALKLIDQQKSSQNS